tara:strand:+ start:394 stop:654 length:261 start_codon:yes stop_codon:yes gene_type:complete
MPEMLVYVLLMYVGGVEEPNFRVHFRTLSQCAKHKVAIEHQSGDDFPYIFPKTNRFSLVCMPKIITSKQAGTEIIFHDLPDVVADK